MAFNASEIQFRYSGGSSNSNAAASLGGIASSVRIPMQTVQTPPNIGGVVITSASNNAQGIGTLSWASATNIMSWQPPGSVYIYNTGVPGDGNYLLGGIDGFLQVTITKALLPLTYTVDTLAVSHVTANVFGNVSAYNSLTGAVHYRCIYIFNGSPDVNLTGGRVWISSLTTGPDELDIGLSPTGAGDGSTTGVASSIANETIAPAGVSFTRPLSYDTGLVLPALDFGKGIALWERRTVPQATIGNITNNTCTLSATVYF